MLSLLAHIFMGKETEAGKIWEPACGLLTESHLSLHVPDRKVSAYKPKESEVPVTHMLCRSTPHGSLGQNSASA